MEDKRSEAFRLLKSLKRGDEVWVSFQGKEKRMFVVRELEIQGSGGTFRPVAWDFANIHVAEGIGGKAVSVAVRHQANPDPEYPYVSAFPNERKIRVVPVGPDLYKRIDELAGNGGARRQLASSFKNMLAQRAKEVPEDVLV